MIKFLIFIFLSCFSYGFIYEFQAKNAFGKNLNFATFEDDALVIFTSDKSYHINDKLRKINKLYLTYKKENIHFLGFAINDSENKDNNDFSMLNYGVDFNMIGLMNNKISLLKNYIKHLYLDEDTNSFIFIYNRKIKRFSNINKLEDYLKKRATINDK